MKIAVFRKNGISLFSDDWDFTFHGLYLLSGNIDQFMYEKGHLRAQSKNEDITVYIPFEDIYEIEVK